MKVVMKSTCLLYLVLLAVEQNAAEEILEGCEYNNLERTYSCINITTSFPHQFYGNYHLRCVNCNIPKFTEGTFDFNNNLETFNVSYSKINIISRRSFSRLTSVQFIYLNNNEIREIAENAFSGAKQLYELHLEHNHLKRLRPKFLNELGTISINLSFNRLEEIADKSFVGVSNVLFLDLSNNKIEKMRRHSFEGLDMLELLNLSNNKICFLPLGVFSSLKVLKNLDLSNNKLNSFGLGVFSGLTSLNTINLANNSLPYFDGEFLLSLENLQTLDISGNGIYYFDTFAIPENSPSLKSLKLDGNIFSCNNLKNMVRYFKKSNIRIESSVEIYEVQNIFGIVCTEAEIKANISYKKFFALAEGESKGIRKIC
ncbi:hypothetical protein HHI36_010349 [Cryptolaemus montrouzieri]|uniref:Uncharacterized protein n=1 Tax=Cryptolaemus montrouzieri TaxID=559131 RepID=A0ABD2MII0_9CUCU